MKRPLSRLALFCSLAFLPALADAKLANPTDTLATFRAIGPRGFRIEGRSNKMTVADDGTFVTITVPLTQLTTGIALRDKHMREKYLETEKFPEAELVVPRWSLRFPEEGKKMSAWTMGNLKMHGKTKEVKVFYKATRGPGGVDVDGNTDINLNDFGIEVPSHLGLSLKPDVSIEVHFQAQDALARRPPPRPRTPGQIAGGPARPSSGPAPPGVGPAKKGGASQKRDTVPTDEGDSLSPTLSRLP